MAAEADAAVAVRGSETVITPQKTSRLGFWCTMSAVIIAVCCVTGLLAREKIRERIRLLRAGQSARNADTAARAGPVLMAGGRPDPMEELNHRLITDAAMSDAERLTQTLFKSPTLEDRLRAIAAADKHRTAVSALFDENPAPPRLLALTPITNPPLSLANGQRLPMFRVVTTTCAAGALLQMTDSDDGARFIYWPLFYETHEGLLARYIASRSREPKWFSVGLRRCHSFELPETARADFDAIDIDGSTDGTGRVITFVAKESPLGRHFASHVNWETFYFGRVLLSWMDIAGEIRPALLDCEGTSIPETK